MPRARKTFLDKLIDKYPNSHLLKRLISKLEEFFVMLNMYNKSNHNKIFKGLYIEKRKTCEVAEDNYIHQETVGLYARKDYSDLAKEFIKNDYVHGLKKAFFKELNL